ncbi:chorismate mutase, putative [Hahella chejuensis KCTC 2396]|uniref:chorismate mutase n=1 Tax=Hahella chejuensis (strain KCTC 2396) TaxID=349521 RepID=Q2SFD9_HAHCH|nr:chorismate mutase [Hahella chejuensis]ABC30635.1 chorismate mutase, putative [Hahella chejuensis KCTC 2396]
MRNVFLLLICLFMSHSSFAANYAEDTFQAINERLSYMKDVALFKAQKGAPVEDVERERVVLDKAKEEAAGHGVDPTSVSDFFSAQISAAKAIQFRYRADWLSDADALKQSARDLQAEVRPALLKLGDAIIIAIADKLKNEGPFTDAERDLFNDTLTIENLSQRDKDMIFQALKQIRLQQ